MEYPHVVYVDGQPHLPRSVVDPDPEQHRKKFPAQYIKELSQSIASHGQRLPINVSYDPARGRYVSIDGECRWRATGLIDENFLLKVNIENDVSDRDRHLRGLIANVQKCDPQPMEKAKGYAKIKADFGWDAKRIGQEVGKSYVDVEYYLALLELHPMLQGLVADNPKDGQLSVGQAWQLVCASRETTSPHDTQFRIIKAMQEGQPLSELVKAVRNQVAMEQQGEMFDMAVDAPVSKEAQGHRKSLEKQLQNMVKFCDTTWDAKTCAVTVSAFKTHELDKVIDQMDLLEKHLAKTRKALKAEAARRRLFAPKKASRKTKVELKMAA